MSEEQSFGGEIMVSVELAKGSEGVSGRIIGKGRFRLCLDQNSAGEAGALHSISKALLMWSAWSMSSLWRKGLKEDVVLAISWVG